MSLMIDVKSKTCNISFSMAYGMGYIYFIHGLLLAFHAARAG